MPQEQTLHARDSGDPSLPAAAAVFSQHRAENFPVALRVLPRALREQLFALYGFARLVDDVGDELQGERLAALARVDAELDTLFAGGTPRHPVLVRLARTVREKQLSEEPLRRLVGANRMDQYRLRYETWDELREYCHYSANPVGELVLELLGAASPLRIRYSNAICSALQLTEHCQDVREDLVLKGRIYLPEEDRKRFAVNEAALRAATAGEGVRALVHFEVARARALLREGEPLLGTLRGYGRLAVAGFVAGGRAALDAIESADGDVLRGAPRPGRARMLAYLVAGFMRRHAP